MIVGCGDLTILLVGLGFHCFLLKCKEKLRHSLGRPSRSDFVQLVIYDAYGNEVGMVVQKVLTFLPKFEIYKNGSYIGCLSKEFSFLTPHYNIDYNGWHIDGTIMEWDYSILDRTGYSIARVSKELFHMTDTYVIDVQDPGNALDALMFVLAIDAEKCSRN